MQPRADVEDVFMADVVEEIAGIRTVAPHEKEFDETTLVALAPKTPFALVRYGGSTPIESERGARGENTSSSKSFHLALGAQSLRSKKDSQRGCYELMDDFEARYNGLTLTVNGVPITFVYDGDAFLFRALNVNLTVYGMVIGFTEDNEE